MLLRTPQTEFTFLYLLKECVLKFNTPLVLVGSPVAVCFSSQLSLSMACGKELLLSLVAVALTRRSANT